MRHRGGHGQQSADPQSRPDAHARLALWASAVGYGVEGFDLLLLVFLLPSLRSSLALSDTRAGLLMTGTLIGAVVGGFVFGLLSDRFGRVRVLTWTIVLFGVCTGLCAVSRGFYDLLLFRTLAGLGFGGEFGVGLALVAETWPAALRARASSYVALGGQAGILAAAFATPLLLPHIGWRGMFVVGLIPVALSFGLRRILPEPEIFVASSSEARSSPLRLLVCNRQTVRIGLGMVILCSVQQIGYYGLMTWLPSYLMSQRGLSLTRSAVWTAATVAGMSTGIWIFGQLADRIGRKPSFYIFQVGAIVAVLSYSRLTSPTSLLIGGALMGVFVNGMLGGYGALLSELYPTEARATAQNVFFNIGRAFGGLGPLLIARLATRFSFSTAIAALAGLYALDILATAMLIPETRGKALAS